MGILIDIMAMIQLNLFKAADREMDSCILLSVLESAVTGVHVHTSISLKLLSFIAIIYVDDTDILLTDMTGHDTLEQVFHRAKKAENLATGCV